MNKILDKYKEILAQYEEYKERMEREKLETENKLLLAKIEALEVAKNTEALYGEAIKAMKHYGGHDSPVTEVLEDE